MSPSPWSCLRTRFEVRDRAKAYATPYCTSSSCAFLSFRLQCFDPFVRDRSSSSGVGVSAHAASYVSLCQQRTAARSSSLRTNSRTAFQERFSFVKFCGGLILLADRLAHVQSFSELKVLWRCKLHRERPATHLILVSILRRSNVKKSDFAEPSVSPAFFAKNLLKTSANT